MNVTSVSQTVSELLGSNFYYIPRFQRPYRWEKDDVTDFWNDATEQGSGDHFIGSVVVYGEKTLGITDGQQRLTTIILCLCAIRDQLSLNGHVDSAQGVQAILERKDIENKPRFILETESSYPYFQDHILKYGDPDGSDAALPEELALKAAFSVIQQLVQEGMGSASEGLKGTDKAVAIKDYLSICRDKLLAMKFILVRLETEEDAYIIFETLNARGKDLLPEDMIKGFLLKNAVESNQSLDTHKDNWAEMQSTIESLPYSPTVTDFLYHYWHSKYPAVAKKKLYREVRKQVRPQDSVAFLKELWRESGIYRTVHTPSVANWPKEASPMINSIEAINSFRIRLPYPMMISLIRAYESRDISLKLAMSTLRAIESFHFFFTAVTSSRSSGGISSMFALHARLLSEARSSIERRRACVDLVQKLRDRKPSYDEFAVSFRDIHYTSRVTKRKSIVRYILNGIDSSLRDGIPVNYNEMTIEHILPESKEHDNKLVGRLGNLVLLPNKTNGILADKPFTEKKPILLGEPVCKVSQVLTNAKDFGEREIDERTEELAKLAYDEVWSI